MNNQIIVCCVLALLLGMLLANMLKNVCGCKLVEGQTPRYTDGTPMYPHSCFGDNIEAATGGGATRTQREENRLTPAQCGRCDLMPQQENNPTDDNIGYCSMDPRGVVKWPNVDEDGYNEGACECKQNTAQPFIVIGDYRAQEEAKYPPIYYENMNTNVSMNDLA